jgi:hypothetical protein
VRAIRSWTEAEDASFSSAFEGRIYFGQQAAPVGFLAQFEGFCRDLSVHSQAAGGLVAEADVLGNDAQIDPLLSGGGGLWITIAFCV